MSITRAWDPVVDFVVTGLGAFATIWLDILARSRHEASARHSTDGARSVMGYRGRVAVTRVLITRGAFARPRRAR